MVATWIRSSTGSPRPANLRARYSTSPRWPSISRVLISWSPVVRSARNSSLTCGFGIWGWRSCELNGRSSLLAPPDPEAHRHGATRGVLDLEVLDDRLEDHLRPRVQELRPRLELPVATHRDPERRLLRLERDLELAGGRIRRGQDPAAGLVDRDVQIRH